MMTGQKVDSAALLSAGIRLCRGGDWERGLTYLMQLARSHQRGTRLPGRFYSFLGYAVAMVEGKHEEGLSLCRHAVELEFYEPENLFNLARTELLAGNREGAIRSVLNGLKLDPGHEKLQALQKRLGVRQKPLLPFLNRGNFLNRMAGQVRASFYRRKSRKTAPVHVQPPEALSRLEI